MKRYIKSAISEPNQADYDTLLTMLDDPKLRPSVLSDMYDKYPNMHFRIAKHPNTPADVLYNIAKYTADCNRGICDWRTSTFDALAGNPNSTVAVLDLVAHKCAGWAYKSLIKHPNVSYKTLSYISKDTENTSKEVRKLAKERMKER